VARCLALCAVMIAALGCGQERAQTPAGTAASAPATALLSDTAPPFDLPLVGGGNVTLESLRGQTVLVDFWATWCPPCLREIPELNAISREFDGKGARVLAISVDGLTLEALGDWLAERDAKYPVALGDTDLAGRYGADGFPFHVVIGPDGKVRERLSSGFHDRDELRSVLTRHLAQ